MADIVAWHGRTLAQHIKQRDDAAKLGYRFLTLGIYGTADNPLYAAVMIKRPQVVAQHDWPCLTANEFQTIFNQQAALGYGPVMIAATGSASDPRFAAVFQPLNPLPLTRHALGFGDPSDSGTIQGMNAKARADGLILSCAASYGDAGNPRFAAIWVPNTNHTMWNNDGLLDTPSQYQGRFTAHAETWCRPSFVTLDHDSRYLSLFVDNEIGPWIARHNMSAADYQTAFDTCTAKGYFPSCVQAAGTDAASARFAALFVQGESPVEKQFQATGPVINVAIDAVIRQAMRDSPVRHAALAIVRNKRLVYARGYTMAEPGWPVAQPTTCFRMASVSKTVTSLAVFQLIEAGKLKLGDTLESILGLTTPAGGPPVDSRFGAITVRHLLEHTSGLNANAFTDGPAVQQAFAAAGHAVALPVTADMTDSCIASLGIISDPGTKQAYSNCGYYLLGRIVARLRGKSRPIDAYQSALFGPLGIHRIRRAVSLVVGEPVDEARYQDPALPVGPSMMSNDRPLVASEYGTEQLEIMEGSGGLTGAVTDIARLVAMVMDQSDTPAMKRSTMNAMLSVGSTVSAAGMGRAGYGFDYLAAQPNGRFYGQKGGSLASSGNVFEVNGDWGFVMNWGGKAFAAQNWYPDYPSVMNIARTVDWGEADLFPQFGMSSL